MIIPNRAYKTRIKRDNMGVFISVFTPSLVLENMLLGAIFISANVLI